MIDTHAHLDDEKLVQSLDEIIATMPQDNLVAIINNSCNKQSMQSGFEIAQKYRNVFCTVGMHPHDAKDFDDDFVELMKQYATNDKVVAVGEIGLDYYYDLSERSIQKDVFACQIEIADQLKLPVTLHIRDAYKDAQDILETQKKYLNSGVVWHCYSGSAEFARQMAKKGHYFAFGGAITFKNADKGEVVNSIPLEQILTETDSPYLTPVPFRGQTNFPRYVSLVTEKLAQLLGKPLAEVERQVEQNALEIFSKMKL